MVIRNISRVAIALFTLCSLTGCSALNSIFLSGMGIIQLNRVITEKRSFSAIKNDHLINYQLNRQLLIANENSEIYAITYNQVVLLLGQSTETAVIKHANDCAKTTKHVRHMFNQITLQKPISAWQRLQDAGIKKMIYILLILTSHVRLNQLMILVEDKVVFLLGKSTKASATSAAQAIQQLPGIAHIVQAIEYID